MSTKRILNPRIVNGPIPMGESRTVLWERRIREDPHPPILVRYEATVGRGTSSVWVKLGGRRVVFRTSDLAPYTPFPSPLILARMTEAAQIAVGLVPGTELLVSPAPPAQES